MSKKRLHFYPYPSSKPDSLIYDQLLNKLHESDHLKRALKKAQNNKKNLLRLVHQLLWTFFSENRNQLEHRIKRYFTIDKKIGHTLLWKAFMPSSYENSEPHNVGFVIEVADLICKYIEDDLEMTFYKWTQSTSPEALNDYLTIYNEKKQVSDIDQLYKFGQDNNEKPKKKSKKKKKKNTTEQFFLIGKKAKVIKKLITYK